MLRALQIVTLMLSAFTMTCTVAHALELPGKMRLPEAIYLAVQPIYYPGFTLVGGFAEIGSVFATFALLFLTPRESPAFWLTLAALVALLLVQVIFWIFTQPVNRVWLRDQKLSRAGTTFFRTGSHNTSDDWSSLRNRWEYSHAVRALFSTAALALLAIAISVTD